MGEIPYNEHVGVLSVFKQPTQTLGISRLLEEPVLMEHADVVKSNGKPVQATGQHGEKLQALVISQGGTYLACLNNMFQVCYCVLLRVPIVYFLHLFTMQNGERVVRVVGNVGSSMSSRVELVVLRGQVYFQSEESLSKFMSNTAVISYLPVPRIGGE